MRTANHQNRSHYPALDGLRGVAILLVVFYHNFGFIDYFFFGWLGVDLFFVLSGFLITDILLKTRNSPNYLQNFYAKRVLRIFPLYYLTLALFLILIPTITHNILHLDYYVRNQIWFWTYLQNWLFIFHPSNNTGCLTHLWSLAVEEQFYLVWPFIILLFRKPRSILTIIFFLLFGLITLRFILWINQIKGLSYFFFYIFSRVDGICVGSLLAVSRVINYKAVNRHFTIILLGLSALNFIFYFFNKQNQFSYPYLAIAGYTTFAVLFGLLVNEGIAKEETVIIKFLSFKLFRFFGTISYSLYVFHVPIYSMLATDLMRWSSQNIGFISASLFASAISTALSVLLAWLSFRFFEKKFLLLKEKFR